MVLYVVSYLECLFHALLCWAWHEGKLSHFYVTVFAKSAQLWTHQSTLRSKWIIVQYCVYQRKFDTLLEVPSPFYIPCLLFVWCITITDSSSFSKVLLVSHCPHVTIGWSLSFLLWQYHANTSLCAVASGKHPCMCTFFTLRCLWCKKKI